MGISLGLIRAILSLNNNQLFSGQPFRVIVFLDPYRLGLFFTRNYRGRPRGAARGAGPLPGFAPFGDAGRGQPSRNNPSRAGILAPGIPQIKQLASKPFFFFFPLSPSPVFPSLPSRHAHPWQGSSLLPHPALSTWRRGAALAR